jgi:hypothetical protein
MLFGVLALIGLTFLPPKRQPAWQENKISSKALTFYRNFFLYHFILS